MLWGRSGNLCAFPDCDNYLIVNISETDNITIVGEEAHIVAKSKDGARGVSALTRYQRDNYDNLILMCSVHHKVIDDNPDIYTVDRLHYIKKNHESLVEQNLSIDNKKQKEDEVYASYIDQFLKLADIRNYTNWTSWLLSSDGPKMYKVQYEKLVQLSNYIIERVWHNRYPELENALLNFKDVLNDLLKVINKYSEEIGNGEQIWTRKFYKINYWDEKQYNELLGKYIYHVNLVNDLTYELTRAANFLFDKVRQQLVPNFRIKEGVLLVKVRPSNDISLETHRLEYTLNERTNHPYPGLLKFMDIRVTRDTYWGSGVSQDYLPPFF